MLNIYSIIYPSVALGHIYMCIVPFYLMHLRRYYPPALQVQNDTMLSAISIQGRTHTYVECNGVNLIITRWYLHLVQSSIVSISNRIKPLLSF